jgi:hypothetical protein
VLVFFLEGSCTGAKCNWPFTGQTKRRLSFEGPMACVTIANDFHSEDGSDAIGPLEVLQTG